MSAVTTGPDAALKTTHFLQADATALPLADQCASLVLGSPPYLDARTYGIGAQRNCSEWIDWMLAVTTEACRVSRGLVLWVCAGVTRDRCYQPGPEGLLYEWWKRGGMCWRPCYWHRVGIPGSGGKHWLRADIEYVLAFKATREWPEWSDNTANGHPPKWAPGGEMSHRLSDGKRVNQWGPVGSSRAMGAVKPDGSLRRRERPSHNFFGNRQSPVGRRADGTRKPPYFNGNQSRRLERGNEKGGCKSPLPVLANPGNLVKVIVGGGAMGHPAAHENEAPYPVALAEWFIRMLVPPGGLVVDPFSGSGTTADAAWRLGGWAGARSVWTCE